MIASYVSITFNNACVCVCAIACSRIRACVEGIARMGRGIRCVHTRREGEKRWRMQDTAPATHCNTLQHTATESDTLHIIHPQHTATRCNTERHTAYRLQKGMCKKRHPQHAATRCNTLATTATHCTSFAERDVQDTARHLQHAATRCNTLQHAATHAEKNNVCAHPTQRLGVMLCVCVCVCVCVCEREIARMRTEREITEREFVFTCEL